MLKNSMYLVGLLLIVLGVTGCASLGKTTALGKNAGNAPSTNLPQAFQGSWVVQVSCDRRPGMSNRIEHGLLEITKKGRSDYEAIFYIFEVQKNRYGSRMFGSAIKMEGKSVNRGTEIRLTGDKWLLTSNRKKPISFSGTLNEEGFFLKGKVLGDPSCPTFIASKFPENSPTARNSIIQLDEFMSKSRKPADQSQCINLFGWIGGGKIEKGSKNAKQSLTKNVNSLFFEEDSFVRFFGKSYTRWTSDDAKAYSWITQQCEQIITRNYYKMRSSPLKMAHEKYKRAGGLPFLSVGKDSKNVNFIIKQKISAKDIFDAFKSSMSEPISNITWANNYFILSAVKSAKIYQQALNKKLNQLDPSEPNLIKLKKYQTYEGFPLNFLPSNLMSSFKSEIASTFNKKQGEYEQALYKSLENLDSSKPSLAKLKGYQEYIDFPRNTLPVKTRSDFKLKVDLLYKNKQAMYVEKLLLDFNFNAYPKTLEGLKSLLHDSKSIKHNINTLEDRKKSAVLVERFYAIIDGHSLAVSNEFVGNIPPVDLTPSGYIKLSKYVRSARKSAQSLNPQHNRITNEKFNLALNNYFDAFYSNMDNWVSENINEGPEGINQLDKTSKQLFGRNIFRLENNLPDAANTRKIATRILQEIRTRQDACDRFAAHPHDKLKPESIRGVSDMRLNVNQAVDACIASVDNQPNNIRLSFQLGRALFVGQLYEDAFEFIEEASKQGYAPANYYLANYYARGLGSATQDVSKSELLYKLSANNGFKPASIVLSRFEAELQSDIRQRQAEESKRLRIANEKFKFDLVVNAILTGDYKNVRHGLAIKYVYGVLLQLYEIGGEACSKGLSHANLTEMYKILTERHAKGYVKFRKNNQRKTGWNLLDNANEILIETQDYNDKYDDLNNTVLNDMALLLGKYQCSGDVHRAFITNGIKFILGPDAPPYNLVSERFWSACVSNANVKKVSNERFCSCYLDNFRRNGINREDVEKLYTNFWPTTLGYKNKSKEGSYIVNRCSNPPKR